MPAPVQLPEICQLSACALRAALHQRKLSAREVLQAYWAHIAALNPQFNALVSLVEAQQAHALADAADARAARGEPLGALHGLPLAIKDTTPTRGLRTTFGSPLFAQHIPAEDAIVAARMRAAGAIVIGKTNVPEFGLGSHTYNPVFGTTGNAWDARLSAGGSSGGAAVALALRMLPIADGSDMGGSLRNPAAFNHVLGFRPSQGRVPHHPRQDAFADQLITAGPLARNAADLALLLSVQSGYDARAPLSLDGHLPYGSDLLARDFTGLRIGWLGDLDGYLPFESGILPLCQAALARLEPAGVALHPVPPTQIRFDWERLWRAFVVLRQFGLGQRFATDWPQAAKRALMKPELQWELEQAQQLTVADVQQALQTRTDWYDHILRLFRQYDFLALPTAQVFPFPKEQPWPRTIGAQTMDSYHRWMEVVVPGTLSACPVISVPAGFGAQGLPMGVQIIGRPREDWSVLQITRLYETLTPEMACLPPVIDSAAPCGQATAAPKR